MNRQSSSSLLRSSSDLHSTISNSHMTFTRSVFAPGKLYLQLFFLRSFLSSLLYTSASRRVRKQPRLCTRTWYSTCIAWCVCLHLQSMRIAYRVHTVQYSAFYPSVEHENHFSNKNTTAVVCVPRLSVHVRTVVLTRFVWLELVVRRLLTFSLLYMCIILVLLSWCFGPIHAGIYDCAVH